MSTNNGSGSGGFIIGTEFRANESGEVCALGIYAGNNATYSGPETVGLYGSQLLATAAVTDSDALIDGYYWAPINPVAISAGQYYEVVDEVNNNGWASGAVPIDDWATFNFSSWASGGLRFLNGEDDYFYAGVYGPDVMMATPEPSSLLLLGSGFSGLAIALRHKLRRRQA